MTDEANVQRFARPENSGFAMTGGGRWISRPVTINRDWVRLAPYRALQISNWQISRDVKGFDDAISAHFSSILHAGGTRCFGRYEVSIICVTGWRPFVIPAR